MKVYRQDGTFITRAERQAIKEDRKDKIIITIAIVALVGIIIFCSANNIPLLEDTNLL